jgi:hypothetical protein
VINVIVNTVKPLSIVSEGTAKNEQMRKNDRCGKVFCFILFIWGELYENYYYRTDFSFELLIVKVFEVTR